MRFKMAVMRGETELTKCQMAMVSFNVKEKTIFEWFRQVNGPLKSWQQCGEDRHKSTQMICPTKERVQLMVESCWRRIQQVCLTCLRKGLWTLRIHFWFLPHFSTPPFPTSKADKRRSLKQQSKGSIPDDLDKAAQLEFWQDSPLHQELRRAFQKQLAGLREKNKDLEDKIGDLENKIEENVSFFDLMNWKSFEL